MKKLIAALVILPVLVLAGLYGVVLYNGPRMKVQPNIRTFQAILPALPPGATPVAIPEQLPSAVLSNPLAGNAEYLERGRVYYQYYCVFCHGEKGDGSGPVGQSYLPVPADLRSSKIKNYRDGELLRAMLKGDGHDPVLERVVDPRHRWYVVLFVRSLSLK